MFVFSANMNQNYPTITTNCCDRKCDQTKPLG